MGTDRGTLLDITRMQDPRGVPAMVAEVLAQQLPFVEDAPVRPANAKLANKTTIRNTLPTIEKGKFNRGVTRSKGTVRNVTDTIAMYVGLSEVDTKFKHAMGDAAFNAYRADQDKSFIESFRQAVGGDLLYGDEDTDDEDFTGLAPRLGATASAITGSQVRSMGSVVGGDGTSIYLVDWGDKVFLMHPEGATSGGLQIIAHNTPQQVLDSDSKPFMAMITEFHWYTGLVVKDPRHIARLANIDVSDANLASPTQGKLVVTLNQMLAAMPQPVGQRVMYVPHQIEAAWWTQQQQQSNVLITLREYLGKPLLHYRGIPVKVFDQIATNESTVS